MFAVNLKLRTMINSNRQFRVLTVINGITDTSEIDMIGLIDEDDDSEVLYAMQEDIDRILDLNKDESMFFQPIRDDSNSKGIILRIDK